MLSGKRYETFLEDLKMSDPENNLVNIILDGAILTKSKEDKILGACLHCNPYFIGKMTEFVKYEMKMDKVSYLLIKILSVNMRYGCSRTCEHITRTPEDALQILNAVSRPIPNQIKIGLKKAVEKFSETQLMEAPKKIGNFSMVDLFNLVHPKPKGEIQTKVFQGAIRSGKTFKMFSVKDIEYLKSGLRNKILTLSYILEKLPDIVKIGDSELNELCAELISSDVEVYGSKKYPSEFLSALSKVLKVYKKIGASKDDSKIIEALSESANKSILNTPSIVGKTLILVDCTPQLKSENNSILNTDVKNNTNIAFLFAAIARIKNCDVVVNAFADNYVDVTPVKGMNLYTAYNSMVDNSLANVFGCLKSSIYRIIGDTEEVYDNIVIFTDSTMFDERNPQAKYARISFDGLFSFYRKKNPYTNIVCVDLLGISETDLLSEVKYISGYSDCLYKIVSMKNIKEVVKNYSIKHY